MSYGNRRSPGAARKIVGALAATGALIAFLVALAGPAGAHTALKASSPKDGGKIDAAPTQLLLEFTRPILTVGYRIVVEGPDGQQYQSGAPRITNFIKIAQPLKPLGPSGEYRVEFRVVAYDGHPLTGGMRFTLTKPGPAAGGAQAEVQPAPLTQVSTNVNNAPGWAAWLGGALALVLISGAVLFGRRVTRDLD